MLSGKAEAEAFEKGDFVKLHQSTLRKVAIIAHVFDAVANRKIVTDTKWYQMPGYHPQVLVELVREHWIFALIATTLTVVGACTYWYKFMTLF